MRQLCRLNQALACMLALLLVGCVSLPEINTALARVDRAWQLDYQRTEDEYRYRVVDTGFDSTFAAVRRTFLDLGMPIQVRSTRRGVLVAENAAPAPLTLAEWSEVVRVEGPRVKEIGGWFMQLSEKPDDYVVTVRATLRPLAGKTLIVLDYLMDNPSFREMGLKPPQHAPPLAVQLGTLKFWSHLERRLLEASLPKPRKRTQKELEV